MIPLFSLQHICPVAQFMTHIMYLWIHCPPCSSPQGAEGLQSILILIVALFQLWAVCFLLLLCQRRTETVKRLLFGFCLAESVLF